MREVVWPILLVVVLLVIKHSVHDKSHPNPKFSHSNIPVPRTWSDTFDSGATVFVAPCDPNGAASAVQSVAATLQASFGGNVTCLASGSDVDAAYLAATDSTFGAVVFNDAGTLGDPTADVSYSLHLDVDSQLSGFNNADVTSSWSTAPDESTDALVGALLPLQAAVEQAVLQLRGGASVLAPSLTVQQFPTMPYSENYGTEALQNVLPIYLLIIYSIQIRVLLTRILEEKEKKITEGMRMQGLTAFVHWSSWLCMGLIKNGAVTVILSIVVVFGGLFPHSDFTVVLVFFLLFLLTAITCA